MDGSWFDAWTRRRVALGLGGLAAGLLGAATGQEAAAKTLCKKNGAACRKKSKRCKAKYCEPGLQAPFTIEAVWSNPNSDHDSFLYVPPAPGSAVPAPYISMFCTRGFTNGGAIYPFAFASGDAEAGPGSEVTTVEKLLDGEYEFHLQLTAGSPSNDVTVRLVKQGKVLQSWRNPASPREDNWRVFSLTVKKGRGELKTMGDVVFTPVPATYVCPD